MGRAGKRLAAWAALFRLPNLATAAGDAVAGGAAVAAALPGGAAAGRVAAATFAAGLAELLLYMGGLADNDLVDEEADRAAGSARPLATGAIGRRGVRAARAACFAAAATVGAAAGLGARWWCAAAATLLAVVAYDRTKERFRRAGFFLMGACRGLAAVSGAAAAAGAAGGTAVSALPVAAIVAGWTLYTAAVTKLGAGEERAEGSLGPMRFAPAVFALVPVVGTMRPLPAAGCFAAAAAWCAAVAPLGRPHGPQQRGRAVGRAIGGLLWMQTGFVLAAASRGPCGAAFAAFAAACWGFRVASRALAPSITGS